jgi:hypothetical protein
VSKKALKKYVRELSKEELEEQIEELYDRLKEVREFYDFVFNPKEDKMVDEAKFKVYKEYFPPGNRKAKKRRSVAQKFIKNFIKLGVDPSLTIDLMLYHIEIALLYNGEKEIRQEAFYKAMLKAFEDAIKFIDAESRGGEFNARLEKICDLVNEQQWQNQRAFEMIMDKRY